MSIPRYAAKRDNVEPTLVKALEACGVSVERTDKPFDAVINFRNRTELAEFKDPKKRGHKDEFTSDQQKFFRRNPGWRVEIFRTHEDVTEFVRRATI